MKGFVLFLAQLGIFGSLEAKDCFFEQKKIVDGEFYVEARHYPFAGSKKSILIIPPTGGTNLIDRSYARYLCAAGYDVYILDQWTRCDEYALDLDIHRRYYARTQRAIELIISSLPQSHSVGILGTSVGALHASIATGRLPRIGHALLITGGADITGLIVDSDQEIMRDARLKRNRIFGFRSRDEYYHELKKHIELDPLFFQDGFKGKKISLVIADKDTTVPARYQRLLQKITGSRRSLDLNDDHFWAILKTWLFHRDFVLRSFE